GVDLARRVGQALRVDRLLPERADAPGVVRAHLDGAELGRLGQRLPASGHRDARARVDVLLYQLARIHPVDVVGPEDDHIVRVLVVDEVQALVDRVRGAGEP